MGYQQQGTNRVDTSDIVLKAVKVGIRDEGRCMGRNPSEGDKYIDGRLVKQYNKRVVERVEEWCITVQEK